MNTTAKSDALLATKLYIPRTRRHVVPRPHLIARLNEGSAHKLTLLSAPAGFGKTTLLAEWIRQHNTPVAWLSLDENDNDPIWFWTYVIAALQILRSGLGEETLAVLHSPQRPSLEAMLTLFINEIAAQEAAQPAPSPSILVLDDYHVIESPPIHDGLSFVLEHLPDNLHLVIATRIDPPLPLARLRLRGELLELRADALRFTPAEVVTFLKQTVERDLTDDEVAALAERTEGWIAALQAAALSLSDHQDVASFISTFTGSHRYIMDYLVDEVLQRQPDHIQTFLLQTAILERLSGPLCEAVTGQEHGQAALERLEAANLFVVPLDDERRWYRYHQLFADVLRHRLQLAQPQNVPEYHRRASAWFEQHGLVAEAIEHALAAADWARAGRLIDDVAGPLVDQPGHVSTVLRWLEALPEDVRQEQPQLNLWYAFVLYLIGRTQEYERPLRAAEQVWRERGDEAALGGVFAVRAHVACRQGDAQRTIAEARPALARLPADSLFLRSMSGHVLGVALGAIGEVQEAATVLAEARALSEQFGSEITRLLTIAALGDVQAMQGELRRAAATYQEVIQEVGEKPLWPKVKVCIRLGGLSLEWNDLDQAQRYLHEGITLGERLGWDPYLVDGYLTRARLLWAGGDELHAQAMLDQGMLIAQRIGTARLTQQVEAYRVRLKLAAGDLATAVLWANERGFAPDDELPYEREAEHLTYARVLTAQGRPEKTIRLLERLLAASAAASRMGRTVEMLAVQALAYQAAGEVDQASSVLAQALLQAEPEGHVRTFVDEGPTMARLLRHVAMQGVAPHYVQRLLEAFGPARPATPPVVQLLVEPLTERELEVLHLIATGLSNRAMAEALVITVGTVKRHITNIYGKLGVNNRVQAVAKARALHVLQQ